MFSAAIDRETSVCTSSIEIVVVVVVSVCRRRGFSEATFAVIVVDDGFRFSFENKTASIPPVFSLALDRPSPDNPVGGGLLAIGGIPDVAVDGDFVSVPIYPFFMDTYAFYTIPLDGIASVVNLIYQCCGPSRVVPRAEHCAL